jgi:hypothetical protein
MQTIRDDERSAPPTQAKARNHDRIRELNDALRQSFDHAQGRILLTAGVDALPSDVKARLIRAIATFSDWNADNDPHQEHDFCAVEIAGQMFFAKIDYYDPTLEGGSEDPSDPTKTTRVLTLTLAEEY